jgi:hypothetical protein
MANDPDELSDAETRERMERALKKSLQMKPFPHKKKTSRIANKVRKAMKPTDSA